MWGVFKAIGRAFKGAGTFVGRQFVRLFGSEAARDFAHSAQELLRSEVGQIVWRIVIELAATQMVPAVKFATAMADIKAEAARSGIEVKESLVRMLIEIAVQRVKGEFGDPPPELEG